MERRLFSQAGNVPVKLKLQHSFPLPTPHAYPEHLTVHCSGRGEFEHCLGRAGNLNRIYLLFWHNTPVSFFGFFQGLMDFQDRISPLLVNTLSKGLQKKLEGVRMVSFVDNFISVSEV